MSTFTLDTLHTLNLWACDTEILQEKYYYLDVDTLSSTILELIKETEVQKCFSFFLSLFGGKLLCNVVLVSALVVVVVPLLSHVWLLQPHGLQPARLLCPWGSADKNTGVGCHFLLQVSAIQQYKSAVTIHISLLSGASLPFPHPIPLGHHRVPDRGSLCYRATSHMTVHKCLVLVNERARIWNKLGWAPECSCLTVLCSSSHRRANLIYIDQKLYTAM